MHPTKKLGVYKGVEVGPVSYGFKDVHRAKEIIVSWVPLHIAGDKHY